MIVYVQIRVQLALASYVMQSNQIIFAPQRFQLTLTAVQTRKRVNC